jgi:DNA-binding LacI/PurR family transcriptional regulator
MADVGRAADVSAQTVSRYFTGTGYVSAETRTRIQLAVEELGYRPNRAARSLRVNRSDTIGVLTVGELNYGTAAITTGLTDAARAAAFPLVVAHLDIDPGDPAAAGAIRTALDFFLSSRVDGIVVNTPYLGTESLLDHVWEAVPVVTLSGRPAEAHDSATADSYAAGVGATRHLVELGHRRILHVAGPADRNEAFERARGYYDVLAEAWLEPLPLVRGDWSAASGYAAARSVDPASFSAVFAGNDQMALGVMAAQREQGRVAPDDYSIVGVDDMPDARYFAPPLSSMFMDFELLGATGFRMIHHRIRTGERLDRVVIPPVLVPRASSGAPPPA